jgi:outer membrane protein assembly factor BamB
VVSSVRLCCLLGSICLPLFLPRATGEEWSRFRGPNGSGVSTHPVPVKWTEKDFNWRVRLAGVGHSSPVLWGDRIFVTSGDEKTGERVVQCLRSSDGRERWSRRFVGTHHRKHSDNSFATATPAVDSRHVYLAWASPKDFLVVALDHDGREIWRADLGTYRAGHGFGASPVVHKGLVIVPNDQDGPSSLVALDATTGKVRWKVPRKGKSSYTTPCVYRSPGGATELIFTNWEHGITSINPETGKLNWEADVFDRGHVETAIGSPVVAGDLVLGGCGWLGVRQEVVAIRPSERGEGQRIKEVYRIARSAPLCTTPLVKDDLLFLWSDSGMVTCADVRTGKIHWRERVAGSYYSSPVCAGEHIYNISRSGEVVVLAASKRFEMAGRNPAGEGSHATPAVADGRLYVRTFGHLLSISGK